MWWALRSSVLHYFRAQTAGDFTLEKRKAARDGLIHYGKLVQTKVCAGPAFAKPMQLSARITA